MIGIHIAVRTMLLLAILACCGCVSLEQAAPPVALLPNSTSHQVQLSQGRDIYVTRCAKCHSVEPVAKYSRAKWEVEILPEMVEKAKLTASETEVVKAYVLAVLANPIVIAR